MAVSLSASVRVRRWRVLRDDPSWRQAPMVFRFETHDFAPFTKDWQLFFRGLLDEAAGDVFDAAFLDLAFTQMYAWNLVMCNEKGFDDPGGRPNPGGPRANYVTGQNLEAPLPQIANLVFGDHELMGTPDGAFLLARTLDPRQKPPRVSRETHPHLIQHAITAQLDGEIAMFPQLSDRERGIFRPVPYPLLSRVEARFPMEGLEERT